MPLNAPDREIQNFVSVVMQLLLYIKGDDDWAIVALMKTKVFERMIETWKQRFPVSFGFLKEMIGD